MQLAVLLGKEKKRNKGLARLDLVGIIYDRVRRARRTGEYGAAVDINNVDFLLQTYIHDDERKKKKKYFKESRIIHKR